MGRAEGLMAPSRSARIESCIDVAGVAVDVKCGSWLCAPNFCLRYRPAARQPQELGLGASHIGFRVAFDAPPAG